MKKEKLPQWLSTRKKNQAAHSILEDLGGMQYSHRIEDLLESVVFPRKVSCLHRCVLITYFYLKKEEFPVVIEDMVKYAGMCKLRLLSLINRHRHALPHTGDNTLGYVLNVYERVQRTLHKSPSAPSFKEYRNYNVLTELYDKKYFHSKSPLLTCVCIYLGECCPERVLEALHTFSSGEGFSVPSIKKEYSRLNQALSDQNASCPYKNTLLYASTQEEEYAKKRQAREKKISHAVEMYSTPLQSIQKYSSDYESVLIENLIKNGMKPRQIYDLTHKGMEYYYTTKSI
ncbi:hypothetical protein NECID01_0526 [Nematocida sp. AWRm77]|nr:hypothetical protein NECID01_0526 [Nematocida sp. AWRm77]